MFWSKKGAPVAAGPTPEEELESALDTVAALLRTFGQKAFDTDESQAGEVQRHFEELATRLLVGPSREEGEAPARPRRDFGQVRVDFARRRVHEQDYVVRSLGNLREAVQAFVTSLSAGISADRRDDAQLAEQVGRLASAVERNDTEGIRREALAVAESVRASSSRRRERERAQLLALGERVRKLRDELESARRDASTDGLTRLFNRAAFDQEAEKTAALALLLGTGPCLILVDVDHFKAVNDDFGHPAGDRVLVAVADMLVRAFLRREDFVSRYGGEEFAIIAPHLPLDAVASRADRLRREVGALDLRVHKVDRPVTVSMGVTPLAPGEAVADWVARADRALYAAKSGGRDRVVVAEAGGALRSVA